LGSFLVSFGKTIKSHHFLINLKNNFSRLYFCIIAFHYLISG